MQKRHLEPETAKTRTEEKKLAELGDGEPSQPPDKYDRDKVRQLEREIELEPGNKFVGWKLGESGAAQEVSPPPTKARLGRTYERPKIEIPCEAGEEVSSHQYISTACLHGQHEKCRRFCKYCKVPCACKGCAHVEEVSPLTPYGELMKRVEDYRSGYSCGYSDAKNGKRMRDKDAASLFFRIEGVPDVSEHQLNQEEVSPPSPEPRETDGHPVGWCCKHCYDGGYQAAMRLRAEGDTRELKAAPTKEIWYVVRKNARANKKAYPWMVYDLQTHTEVAFVGSEEKAKDWARQLNENGYVQAE